MDIIKIRNEMKNDMKIVEDITRKSFYNIYIPGCIEHYLIHIMREHKDFIKELDFVLELNGKVIGNIMEYTIDGIFWGNSITASLVTQIINDNK